ncbi:MAG: rubrerythrin family protein [Rhodospirillales bacterium]|nr:rubrerythrin family protein [Rhodospirillales bacterium]
MPALKSEPPRPVSSIEELFAIAHAMEHEAASRYAELALRMRGEGNAQLADVFDRLAADERGHLDSVVHWSERESGRVPDPARVQWDISHTFDDEGAGTTAPSLLTAYRALSMAVRNEERAFAFWSYVAAHARSADVRRAAETMAHEELEHVATLRRERRRAFHAQRSIPSGATERREVVADLERLERRLAQRLEQMAETAEPDEAERLRDAARNALGTAGQLAIEPLPIDVKASPGEDPDDPVALSELLVDLYLEAAERIRDEAALDRAQRLAGGAISRLAWLRADLPAMELR